MKQRIEEPWFESIPKRQRQLLLLSLELFEREVTQKSDLFDYSFVLFPAAKAFEGFLKHYFFTQGLISRQVYEGKRFRIGRALNPDIHPNGRDEYWLYDDVSKKCGHDLAIELWETWLSCRNQVFHFFPKRDVSLSLMDVQDRLEKLLSAVRVAVLCAHDTYPEHISESGSEHESEDEK